MPTATKPPWETRVDAFAFRNRAWLAPPAVGAALVGVAAGAHTLGWHTAVTIVAAVLLVCGLDAVTDLPLRDDDRWWRRREERLFGAAAWVLGCGWTVWAAWTGVTLTAVAVLAALAAPLGVGWFKHRRVRRAVDVEKTVHAWGDGTIVGLPGTKLVGLTADMHIITGLVQGVRGVTCHDSIVRNRARIASLLGVDKGRVQIEHTDCEADARITVVQDDPHKEAVTWRPPKPGESVVGPKRIGVYPDGREIEMSLFRPEHGGVDGLTVGVKGAGKSNYLELQAAYAAAAPDCLLWMVDLKPGAQQLGPWAPVCDWFATTVDEAEAMFTALIGICGARGKAKGRKVKPTRQKPGIVLIVDEASILFLAEQGGGADTAARVAARRRLADRIGLVERLLATSRSFAISIRVATQYGIWDAVGGSTIRQHLVAGEVVAFRTAKRGDARLVFDLPADEVDTAQIPRDRPGTCYVLSAESDRPVQGRLHEITERQVSQLVTEWTGRQPALEAAAAAAAGAGYATRSRQAPAHPEPDPEPVDVPAGSGRLTPAQSTLMVWRALGGLGRPASPKDVAAVCGRSVDLVGARLRELAGLDAAVNPRRGVWEPLGTAEQLRRRLGESEQGAPEAE